MKKYLIFLNIILVFTMFNVRALTTNEIKSRTNCPSFELAIAGKDKSLTTVGCFDDYNLAKNEMDNSNNDDLVILERSNNETRIINAKYAFVYLDYGEVVTNYYKDSNLKNYLTYMNHSANYGSTEGVFLELNKSNYAARVKVNGITGWLKNGTYRIIPLNFVGNINYYEINNNGLYHYYSKNIETTYSQYGRVLDKKPNNINNGKYYSFDGNYFYSDQKLMIFDYKNGNYNNSINKDNPYYNYYMYLPHRARSNYTADDIDSYLKNTRNLIGTIYGKKYVSRYSNMYGTGIYFKSSETLYGGNAILMMSLATNESALGQSTIAIDKNNLFGHAAYDSSAYSSATGYLNPYQSILGHAKSYINCGYANPNDYRYYGSNVGNKSTGMNIQYASDPYWGEKATNYYYLFDKDNGYLDYNYYQLGITTYSSVNVRTEPNMSSSIPFNLKYENVPVIILGEVEGASYNGNTKWYKIVSDANLNESRTGIQACSFSNYYNYNGYVYVHSAFIKKINNANYNSINNSNDKNYTYKEYSNNATYTPKVGLITQNTEVYDTATLSVYSNRNVLAGHYATVFMEALENGKTIAYLITTDYSLNQKGWVKASALSFADKDILKVNINERGDFAKVYKEPGGSELGNIYDNTYSVIVDKKTYNNDLWLKIHYNLNNTYGWINTNISSTKGSMEYTLKYLENQKPIINANNVSILLYDTFDPLKNVSATDSEDGNLTNKIEVVKNDVNTKKLGAYEVIYQVKDSKEQLTTKTIQVTISDYQIGNPLFLYESLKQINDTKFEFAGFLGVKQMDNKNVIHYLKFVNELDNSIYQVEIANNKNYPYEMSSLDDTTRYDYSGGWFKGEVNLNKDNIKQGNYRIYIVAYNKDKGYKTETYFTNIAYLDMVRRVETSSRGISFDVDYSYAGSPILMSIRDNGLISYDIPETMDPMYNFFNELKIDGNKLTIMGTSHNVGVSYSKNDTIKRELILENTSSFEKISYDVSYIDNGPYQVQLAVSDNKDKTRAWFKKEIDLSNLTKGNYAIYIKTTSGNKTYYGELVDIAYTDFKNINTNNYEFKRIDEKRLRLELIVK